MEEISALKEYAKEIDRNLLFNTEVSKDTLKQVVDNIYSMKSDEYYYDLEEKVELFSESVSDLDEIMSNLNKAKHKLRGLLDALESVGFTNYDFDVIDQIEESISDLDSLKDELS